MQVQYTVYCYSIRQKTKWNRSKINLFVDVYLKALENEPEFDVIFEFKPNPFLIDRKIEVHVIEESYEEDDKDDSKDESFFEITCEPINWENNKDPRYVVRELGFNQNEIRKVEMKRNSFFWIFENFNDVEEMSEIEGVDPFSKQFLSLDSKQVFKFLRNQFFPQLILRYYGITKEPKNIGF